LERCPALADPSSGEFETSQRLEGRADAIQSKTHALEPSGINQSLVRDPMDVNTWERAEIVSLANASNLTFASGKSRHGKAHRVLISEWSVIKRPKPNTTKKQRVEHPIYVVCRFLDAQCTFPRTPIGMAVRDSNGTHTPAPERTKQRNRKGSPISPKETDRRAGNSGERRDTSRD
jgi:hypothetical protein